MKNIKSYFPLSTETQIQDFFQECLNWILDSPHTTFAQEEFAGLNSTCEFSQQKGGELIEYSFSESEELSISSLRYSKSNNAVKYVTEVSARKCDKVFWVSVISSVVTVTASTTSIEGVKLRKSLIAIRLIDRFGGGDDGDFPVTIHPIWLKDDVTCREIARRVIVGDNVSLLPVVYISANANNRHALIPDRLARKLCGMAHVVVEPGRDFSHSIRRDVSSRNVYGGVVGIYWPNGTGVSLCRRGLNDTKVFEDKILETISEALSVLIPPVKCSWDEVGHVKNRIAIEHLRKEGASAQDANEVLALYEAETNATVGALHKEIERLNSLIRHSESMRPVQGGILIDSGDEDDYFEGEILSVILDALDDYLKKSTHSGSRRQHLLESILDSNEYSGLHEQKSRSLKEALRGYREMNKKVRDVFEELGFSLTNEGKHWKLMYQDDDRYTYVLPKTGSDHRGGLNAGADIANIVF
ncbi:hypothetical protein Q1Z72_13785 [Pseudomonas qingdaonensis]|uniref:hypothetical protein n=1 Tax=Pseudomonas qingdaonensis TaxID=2056231 RepID=UPI00265DE827|nr:hypothetical protein [Pseudomonas qingdaonensis]WKL69678.1 hypothetical protein Q1Z72_13785 [Pseudomonas qingdaonensis]